MFLSKGEKILRDLIKLKHPNTEVKYNYKPDWLTNPLTGRKLEIDIYLPNKKMAFEFQGGHHRDYYQSFKDEIKRILCKEVGIKLFRVFPMDLRPFARRILHLNERKDKELFARVKDYMDKCEMDQDVRVRFNEAGVMAARKELRKSRKWFEMWKRVQDRVL